MKEMTAIKRHFHLGLLVAPLMLLPGCFGDDKGQAAPESGKAKGAAEVVDESEVLMKIDGKPRITVKDLDEEFNRLLDESPQLKQVLPLMPAAKLNFFQGLVSQEIIDEYIRREGIDKTPEYKNELARTIEQIVRIMNQKYFCERHPAKVTEAEIEKCYEENKDKLPDLILSPGGVKAEGVSFANEADANAFLATLKETKKTVEQLAKDEDKLDSYRDFKLVNNQSTRIDPALRVKIVAFTRFPTADLVKVGDLFWVIKATEKQAPKYHPFEQVKAGLEDYLKKQKQMELFEKAIDEYKKSYDIELNEEPIKPKQGAMPQMMQQEEIEVAQGPEEGRNAPPAPTQTV